MAANAIFLSASVPDPTRDPKYSTSADTIAIAAAVSGLLYVTLGRRVLVWGGHPAITPIVWAAAEDLGTNYARWVHLFQSRLFEEDFPAENAHFNNVTFVDAIKSDRAASLAEMRRRMLSAFDYDAGVFIGGMEGVEEEYAQFAKAWPKATKLPIASTGGAALLIYSQLTVPDAGLLSSLDFIGLFHSHLHISALEKRQP